MMAMSPVMWRIAVWIAAPLPRFRSWKTGRIRGSEAASSRRMLGRAVGRAVVDGDQLQRDRRRALQDPADDRPQGPPLVVDGHQDAEERAGRRPLAAEGGLGRPFRGARRVGESCGRGHAGYLGPGRGRRRRRMVSGAGRRHSAAPPGRRGRARASLASAAAGMQYASRAIDPRDALTASSTRPEPGRRRTAGGRCCPRGSPRSPGAPPCGRRRSPRWPGRRTRS